MFSNNTSNRRAISAFENTSDCEIRKDTYKIPKLDSTCVYSSHMKHEPSTTSTIVAPAQSHKNLNILRITVDIVKHTSRINRMLIALKYLQFSTVRAIRLGRRQFDYQQGSLTDTVSTYAPRTD